MTVKKASIELREENKIMSSKLKELKSSKKELKEKHDKLEEIHNELTTSYNLQKEEYTNLKINHDNLVLSYELLFKETHDATNNIVKIYIATSCDDLIDESIEQRSSGKGKQVVECNDYDEYIKISSMNTTTNLSNSGMKTEFMRYMKNAGALMRPKGMTRYS